jgi:membrane protein
MSPPPSEPVNSAGARAGWRQRLEQLWTDLLHFPWHTTAQTLNERFREDRLGVTAGSLTFTTIISLVPLFTVVLAVFSAFPMFGRMEALLQKWLIQSLVPEHIARQVSSYLLQFAGKAGQLGWAGALVLLITSLALVLTIDRKLNEIWRVKKLRPLTQRVLVYWAVLTLGPLLLGLSLSVSSYALSVSRGWVGGPSEGLRLTLDALQFLTMVASMAALYRYVPHAHVRWAHALAGGVFVALAFEGAKKALAWYLVSVPTYSLVYGTFATLPILLIWVYLVWVIVLLGAVVVAYMPSLLAGIARRGDSAGWGFELALELMSELLRCRQRGEAGLSLERLAQQLRVDALQLEGPVEALEALQWVGKLADEEGTYVLLGEPSAYRLGPLAESLLLPRDASTQRFWQASRWHEMPLLDALPQR